MAESPLKVLLVGPASSGKTTLSEIFRDGGPFRPSPYIPTIGIDFGMVRHTFNGFRWRLQIWDSAGQERFRTIVSSYFRNTRCVAVVYDVTDRESFERAQTWIKETGDRDALLVGNKIDLADKRQVSWDEGRAQAQKLGWPFVETSAADTESVARMFRVMVQLATTEPPPPWQLLTPLREFCVSTLSCGDMSLCLDQRLPAHLRDELLATHQSDQQGSGNPAGGADRAFFPRYFNRRVLRKDPEFGRPRPQPQPPQPPQPPQVELLLLGDSGVGKTALGTRLQDDTFVEQHVRTLGTEMWLRTMQVNGNSVRLRIRENGELRNFQLLSSIASFEVVAVVYDVSDTDSFTHAERWLTVLQPLRLRLVVLVANKMDLPAQNRIVSPADGQKLAQEKGARFLETSATHSRETLERLLDTLYRSTL